MKYKRQNLSNRRNQSTLLNDNINRNGPDHRKMKSWKLPKSMSDRFGWAIRNVTCSRLVDARARLSLLRLSLNYANYEMPKRKAPAKLSGFVESDDDDLMQLTRSDSLPQDQDHGHEANDEHPSKKRRGRPRTSNESTTESKPPARSTRQNSVQPVVGGEEASKKTTRRGRPRGSSQTSDNGAGPARASTSKEPVGSQEVQGNENERSATTAGVKGTRTTRSGKPTATRGRGRGRTASVARPSATDGDFEYTPTRANTQKDVEIPDTQIQDVPMTDPQVEESVLPDPQLNAHHAQSSIIRNSKARVSSTRTSQDPSPHKRKSTTAEQSGDPELRRRIGDLTRKNDTLESKYRDLREIGVEEAKSNMEKLRKQCEGITTGMFHTFSSLSPCLLLF